MIRVTCPACQLARDYPDHLAGWELACRRCAALVTVGGPDAEHLPDDAEAAQRPCNGAIRSA